MKKIFVLVALIASVPVFSQSYNWHFAMSTGMCSEQPRAYPYDFYLIGNINVLEPIGIETDKDGNIYVLGNFPGYLPSSWPNEYQITPDKKLYSGSGRNALYLYKLNNNGELQWAQSLSSLEQNMGDLLSSTELTINPFSGKIYIVTYALASFYQDQNLIDTKIDNSVSIKRRMMICLNADGTYSNTIFSPGLLDKPIFSSAEKGVFRSSRIAEFYPWPDSLTFYKLDALNNKVVDSVYASTDVLLSYDKQKQAYISSWFMEYTPDLVISKNPNYSLEHLGTKLLYNKIAKDGSHYILYNHVNTGNVLIKYGSDQKKVWSVSGIEVFDLDQKDNPWICVYRDYTEATASDITLVKLDKETGLRTNVKIVPTNLIQQTHEVGSFRISENDEFWIAGFLYNEAEFREYTIGMNCSNNYLPLQHYLAMAKEGWYRDRTNLSVGESPNALGLKIYPNPSNRMITIENPRNILMQSADLYDISGKKVGAIFDVSASTMNIENLENGIYFLKITVDNSATTFKIIKQ